jgi:23S rRNA pseudouridine2457 synthase
LGRLDYESEGLLLLTNDASVNQRLLHPSFAHEREYYVQVEGLFTQAAADLLKNGVDISVNGKKMKTKPAQASLFTRSPDLPERHPPIRYRKNIPVSWISITLTEGKNRQVRKMTAQTGFPTLRLVRWRIGNISIEGLQPGDMHVYAQDEFLRGVFSPVQ